MTLVMKGRRALSLCLSVSLSRVLSLMTGQPPGLRGRVGRAGGGGGNFWKDTQCMTVSDLLTVADDPHSYT